MRSWRIATIHNIPIRIHWTFLILPLFYVLNSQTTGGAIRGVVYIVLVFGCVMLHELGHSLAAQRYGIAVKEILLLPIGGLAKLERMPQKPTQELAVAIAGPAVNLGIVVALMTVALVVEPGLTSMTRLLGATTVAIGYDLLRDIALVNAFLALFNLIPAFPMDGGRILRALLAVKLPLEEATRIAMWVGWVFAAGFVLIGLVTLNLFLALIGLFVFGGAGAEYQMIKQQAAVAHLRAADLVRPVTALHPLDLLETVAPTAAAGAQPLYPVVVGQTIEGVVAREELQAGLLKLGPGTTVAQILQSNDVRSDAPIVSAATPLAQLYAMMDAENLPAVLVVEGPRLLGFVGWNDVARMYENARGVTFDLQPSTFNSSPCRSVRS